MSSSISPLFAVHAEQFLNSGSYAEALELCLRGIEMYPHYPSAYTLTARAMWALGKETEAQEFIVNAVSHFPAHPALLLLEQEFFGLLSVTPAPLTATESGEIAPSTQIQANVLEHHDILIEHDDILPENDDILPENDDILPENDDILLENDDILLENDNILLENENSLLENENSLLENENSLLENDEISPKDERFSSEFEESQLEFEESRSVNDAPNEQIGKYTPLRIVEPEHLLQAFQSSLNASSMNLIPGLDFTPLKFQNGRTQPRNGILPPPPPFPRFREHNKRAESVILASTENTQLTPEPVDFSEVPTLQPDESYKLTPLEELAARLEKVRIPATYEEIARPRSTELVAAMVTETMARIYEKQGAFPEAIKAYQILARRTPEKLEFYEERIREVQMRMMEEEK